MIVPSNKSSKILRKLKYPEGKQVQGDVKFYILEQMY